MFIHDTPAAFYGRGIKITIDILEVCNEMFVVMSNLSL